MFKRSVIGIGVAVAALAIAACKTDQSSAPASAGEVSDGATGASGSSASGGSSSGGSTIPALVSVNLQNVLNDLSVSLQVNRDNIPVTAQVPIAVAASVCGVS